MKTVLSLSGGGLRGIIGLKILVYIESQVQRITSNATLFTKDLFDVIAGTSIGGIMAIALGIPASVGSTAPLYSAEAVLQMLPNDGSTFFVYNPSFSVGITVSGVSFNGLMSPKWSSTAMEDYLAAKCGTVAMKDLLVDTLVTSYDTVAMEPVPIKSTDTVFGEMYCRDAGRATSAACTYFPPFKYMANAREYNLIDGVFTTENNPSISAYLFSKEIAPDEDVLLVSLGCGEIVNPSPTLDYATTNGYGLIQWASPMIKIFLDSSEYDRHLQMSSLLPDGSDGTQLYYRLQPENMSSDMENLDNYSTSNISNLSAFADAFVLEQKDLLDQLIQSLIDIKGLSS